MLSREGMGSRSWVLLVDVVLKGGRRLAISCVQSSVCDCIDGHYLHRVVSLVLLDRHSLCTISLL